MRLTQRLPGDAWRNRTPVTRRVLWAALSSLLGMGCYRDVPTPLDHVSPGSPVRALVVADRTTAPPFDRASDQPAGREQLTIEGTLVERDALRVLFLVPGNRTAVALGYELVNQQISVARQDVLRIDVRRMDAKRTGGLVALIAGAAVVAVLTASTDVGGSVSQPPPSGDVSLRGVLHRSCCR